MTDEQTAEEAAPQRLKLVPPVDWWKLEPYVAMTTLSVLDRFVSELVRRYALRESVVPPCWFQHQAQVQELLALFQYRNQLVFLEESPPSAPIEFHQAFDLARTRLERWVLASGCTSREHIPERVQAWAVVGTDECRTYTQQLESAVAERYAPAMYLDEPDESEDDD